MGGWMVLWDLATAWLLGARVHGLGACRRRGLRRRKPPCASVRSSRHSLQQDATANGFGRCRPRGTGDSISQLRQTSGIVERLIHANTALSQTLVGTLALINKKKGSPATQMKCAVYPLTFSVHLCGTSKSGRRSLQPSVYRRVFDFAAASDFGKLETEHAQSTTDVMFGAANHLR